MKKYIKITPVYAVLCASIVFGTVILDLVTKRLIMATMGLGESITLIKGVLHLTYIHNDGAAFGLLDQHRWVFMTLSSIMIVGLILLLIIWDRRRPLFYIGASLVLGGGIGNMIDRIAYGTVVDFIDFRGFGKLWPWVFNGADSFVCVGSVLLILYYLTDVIVTSVKANGILEDGESLIDDVAVADTDDQNTVHENKDGGDGE